MKYIVTDPTCGMSAANNEIHGTESNMPTLGIQTKTQLETYAGTEINMSAQETVTVWAASDQSPHVASAVSTIIVIRRIASAG